MHRHGHHERHGHREGHGHHDNEGGRGHWAAGRHQRRFGGFGFGGRHGRGGGDMNPDDMRAGRMLAQGDLRLVALALIAVAPRHGYEIIKLVEEKTADWYSPSPGIVYPTLTYLEEAGYVTASTEGSKKLYTITDEGRAYLDTQGDLVKVVLDRLAAIGERVSRWRRESRGDRDDRRNLPPLVEATFDHLREAVAKRIENDPEVESRLVEILARTATELQKA
jgi:DNA-binding PadR family transcriptional regulator